MDLTIALACTSHQVPNCIYLQAWPMWMQIASRMLVNRKLQASGRSSGFFRGVGSTPCDGVHLRHLSQAKRKSGGAATSWFGTVKNRAARAFFSNGYVKISNIKEVVHGVYEGLLKWRISQSTMGFNIVWFGWFGAPILGNLHIDV